MFRAYDAERERLVAVKLFKLDLPPERVHQLVAEFERLIAVNLDHPAIARPVATGISGVAAYLAQDYVAAESLDLVVREYGPAPVADALRVAAQLAGAMDFAAVVQTHHGALHPRDVLLSADETRLTGLGVAQVLQKVGVAVPVRRPYAAPERLSDTAAASRADLFSLAAVIFELISGKRVAGVGDQAVEALGAIAGADTAALRRVFARGLAERAADRFETALEFVDALKHALPQSAVAGLQARAGRLSQSAFPSPKSRPETDDLPLRPASPSLPFEEAPPAPDLPLATADEQRFEDAEVESNRAPDAAEDARGSTGSPRVASDPLVGSPRVASDPLVGSPRVASDPLVLSVSKDEPPAPTIDREIDTAHPEVFSSALERSRSAVWPLVLALIVGIAVGFAGGYGVGSRDRTPPPPTAAAAPPPPAGREFTESAVPAAPATSPRSQAPSPAPLRERRTPGAEPPAPAGIGRLLVRSTPAGARVRVDGKDVGVTPSVVRDLAPGAHRVEVAREGYAAVERRVVITGARPAQSLALSLARVAVSSATPALATPGTMGHFVGSLSVDSRPAGAKVFLDDKLIGTTPLAMASVTAGEHAVRLEYTGYRRWSSSVRVVASEQNRVTASLER